MRRVILCLAVAPALAGYGCDGTAEAPERADEICLSVAVGPLQLAVPLPKQSTADIGGGVVRITTNPGRRQVRDLTLAIAGKPEAGLGHARHLASGFRLDYRVDEDAGGGSGGAEATLVGVIDLGPAATQRLAVTCGDQSEFTPDPTWCLELLERVTLFDGKAGCR